MREIKIQIEMDREIETGRKMNIIMDIKMINHQIIVKCSTLNTQFLL